MHIPPLLLLIHPRFAQIAFFSQGELEGAKAPLEIGLIAIKNA